MPHIPDLLEEQNARFAAIDSLIPPRSEPQDGTTLVATLGDASRVTGLLIETKLKTDSPHTVWSARHTVELSPLLGKHGADGMDAILSTLRTRLAGQPLDNASSCIVTWPSRDVECVRPLFDHGFAPLTALAVRTDADKLATSRTDVITRRATEPDIEDVLALCNAELEYSARVSNLAPQFDDEAIRQRRTLLHERLREDIPLWVADVDDVPVGFVDCGIAHTTDAAAPPLPAGCWGYIYSASVAEPFRGRGIGSALLDAAHADLHERGVRRMYLYYNPANPLSTVFWHRRGYRPLWTTWEVRPASALR